MKSKILSPAFELVNLQIFFTLKSIFVSLKHVSWNRFKFTAATVFAYVAIVQVAIGCKIKEI